MTETEALARAQEIEDLLDALDTCHICHGTLHLEDVEPTHCEDCSGDCDAHDEPACEPIWQLHRKAKVALKALAAELRKESERTDLKQLEMGLLLDNERRRALAAEKRAAALELALFDITETARILRATMRPEDQQARPHLLVLFHKHFHAAKDALSDHSGALDEALAAASKAALMAAAVTIEADESLPLIVRMRGADRLRALAEKEGEKQ